MSFTQNRLDFANDITYDEISNAMAYGKGLPNFVVQGLELTGTTLTNGIFANTGTFGQLGASGETHEIPSNYTGYIVIKSTLNGSASASEIITSATKLDTDPTSNDTIRYFTIYKLTSGVIDIDYRHINYVKEFEIIDLGNGIYIFRLNGYESNPITIPEITNTITNIMLDTLLYPPSGINGNYTYDDIYNLFQNKNVQFGDSQGMLIGQELGGILKFIRPSVKIDIEYTNLSGNKYTIPNFVTTWSATPQKEITSSDWTMFSSGENMYGGIHQISINPTTNARASLILAKPINGGKIIFSGQSQGSSAGLTNILLCNVYSGLTPAERVDLFVGTNVWNSGGTGVLTTEGYQYTTLGGNMYFNRTIIGDAVIAGQITKDQYGYNVSTSSSDVTESATSMVMCANSNWIGRGTGLPPLQRIDFIIGDINKIARVDLNVQIYDEYGNLVDYDIDYAPVLFAFDTLENNNIHIEVTNE